MAVRQPYRGDPEQKLYSLYNNFSGGMNTTDVDASVYTHQFRLLENVELSEKGTVKNREGFVRHTALNELLMTVENPLQQFEYIYDILVLRDSANLIDLLGTATRISEIIDTVRGDFQITLAVIGSVENLLVVKTLTILYNALDKVFTKIEFDHNLDVPYTVGRRYTSLNTVSYGDALYIPLGQLNKTLEGFLEVKLEDDEVSYKILGPEAYHLPDAYEVSNIGFNVLSKDPVNSVAPAKTSTQSIRTFWLTKIEDMAVINNPKNFQNPIYTMPLNGEFILNVLYTGVGLTPKDLTINLYTQGALGEKKYLNPKGSSKILWSAIDGGLFRYHIKVSLEDSADVFIEVKKVIGIEEDIAWHYVDTDEMIQTYLTREVYYIRDMYTDLNTVYVPKNVADSKYGYNIPRFSGFTKTYDKYWSQVDSVTGEELWINSKEPLKEEKYYLDAFPEPEDYQTGSVLREVDSNGDVLRYFILKQDSITVPSTLGLEVVSEADAVRPEWINTWKVYMEVDAISSEMKITRWRKIGTDEYVELPTAEQLFEISDQEFRTPQMTEVLAIYTDVPDVYDFYRYNGKNTGTIQDFDEVEDTEVGLVDYQYINYYSIGTDDGLKKLSGLNTTNAKILEMNGRLVLYEGNTIWFSDLYKFDYIPNLNYVTLPLNGSDEITRIAYFRGSYIIFTKDTIYRMSGQFGADDFSVTLINDSVGCIAPDSVRSINNTLVFLSSVGLYTLKQNYYMEGLENVERVDTQIRGVIPSKSSVESITNLSEVWFLVKDNLGELQYVVKQYYDMPIVKSVYATTVDRYAKSPENILKLGFTLVSYKEGYFYKFGGGYSDFATPDMEEWEYRDTLYTMRIKTPEYNLGYPTHVKKIKNMFIKTYSVKNTKISTTVYVDGQEIINPNDFNVRWNGSGILEYDIQNNYNLKTTHAALATVGSSYEADRNAEQDYLGLLWSPDYGDTIQVEPIYDLDNFALGESTLGVQNYQTHKLVVGGKGKTISFLIEQTSDAPYSIQDIGILHKLGKVKEG